MKTYTKQILIGAIVSGMVIGITLALGRGLRRDTSVSALQLSPTAEIVVETHASYEQLSREDILKQADAIVIGSITQISPTRFNQDSGELWEPTMDDATPLALHYVDVKIDKVLTGKVDFEEKVEVVVLGNSPTESTSHADHHLKSGDQVILFLNTTKLVWRDGTRSVWCFVGSPLQAALILQEDGLYHDGWLDKEPIALEELIAQIQ
jgi:hypothetical protein